MNRRIITAGRCMYTISVDFNLLLSPPVFPQRTDPSSHSLNVVKGNCQEEGVLSSDAASIRILSHEVQTSSRELCAVLPSS